MRILITITPQRMQKRKRPYDETTHISLTFSLKRGRKLKPNANFNSVSSRMNFDRRVFKYIGKWQPKALKSYEQEGSGFCGDRKTIQLYDNL